MTRPTLPYGWQKYAADEREARAKVRAAGVLAELRRSDGTIVDVGADGRDVIDVFPVVVRISDETLARTARGSARGTRRRRK